jgi:N-acetyl-alpha-D-glucosaminyl L-malate synthase BshA
MKIGIACYPTYGGSGVIATELGKALAEKGHEVHFISYNQPARLDSYLQNIYYHEVNINSYPLFDHLPYETILASRFVDIVKTNHLDLLHVHYAIPHASAALMARSILMEQDIYCPVITTLHGTDITLVGKDPTYEPVVAYSINQSNGVTAVSNSLRQETYDHFKIKKEIEVIPNFIDFTRFSKQAKSHFKKAIAPNDEKIIIHTSNFRKVKRVDDVIRIFAGIHKEIKSKLLLVGDGPERGVIEHMCKEYNVCDNVLFLGKQEAIEEVLSVGDLFLLPSETESFGLAALEAMACEVPVISTNAGGLPEVNINGVTGFACDVGDVETMSQKAIYILSDEERHEKFKKNSLAQAQKYNITEVLPLYVAYYNKVLNECQKITANY